MSKVLKMFLGTGLFVVFVSFFPINSTYAEELDNNHDKLYEVQTESIMRTAPNEEAERIGTLIEGDKLRTFEEKDGWVKTFYNGQPVWVYSEELLLVEDNSVLEETETNEDKEEPVEKPEEKEQEGKEQEETKVEENHSELAEEDNDHSEQQHEDFFFEKNQPEHALEEQVEIPVGIYKPNKVQVSEDTIVVTKNTLDGYNILIDAGHGGKDAGAVKNGVYEKNIALSTAKKVAEYLKEEGATVNFTRKDDTFISLQNRVKQSNTHKTDVFISLHYDYFSDSSVNGINTYYSNATTSGNLAKAIHTALTDNLDMHDRGIKKEGYYVLAHNQNPAVLLELGFMTNPGDLEKMQSDSYQESVAIAITEGLLNYFDEASVE
ncbi:N-acetylmuramoyl-L-alanine amidase [Paucisalibacillus globulus]|uniref:N-acetylmuramoyl-L-alanine amidase n=1 Tax=Paucisalibacillus globulus TaxID=351095 RepID=UPI000BB843DE|nr:N-acetylmuramoyl-L-alanine amidase [Paucisalibacillus globulus]